MKETKSGIYCIENLVNGKRYIGKGKNVEKRMWQSHKRCSGIEGAFNKYGEKSFVRYIIEYCEDTELSKREQYYIEQWDTKSPNGYNLTSGGDGGFYMTEESRKKLSLALRGRKFSEEHKKNIGLTSKGRMHTDEWKKNMSMRTRGKNSPSWGIPKTDEQKRKQREKMSGENSPNYGKHHSEEWNNKISTSNIGKKTSDKAKEKQRKSRLGKRGIKQKNASSQYFGVNIFVCKYKGKKKESVYIYWEARTHKDEHKIGLGVYKTELDAARAYDKYIVENSLNAPLNFPKDYE